MLLQNKDKFDYCNIPLYHNKGIKGQGVKIGVLFDDYQANIPLFNGKVHGIPQFNTGISGDIHGFSVTHVLLQTAPMSEIYYLPFSSFNFDEVVDWCIDNKINIITMSFRGSDSDWFIDGSLRLIDSGIVLICSAGNNGDGDNTLGYAAMSNIWISIGAVDIVNGLPQRVSYSSVGEQLDFCGLTNIYVGTDPNNPLTFSGTSCATPFCAGMISLFAQWHKEKYNKYPNQQIAYEFMKNNCLDLEILSFDNRTGHGLFRLPKEIDSMEIKMKIGSNKYTVDGIEKTMDTAPFIKDNRTFVPVRFVAEELGCEILWDSKTQTVTLIK